jgi:arabinofuranosyltransferase
MSSLRDTASQDLPSHGNDEPRGFAGAGPGGETKTIALTVVAIATAIFAAAVSLVFLYFNWAFTVDDSFIWFRYAENLSAGYGPTFNPGKPPVEGCTGFLWILVMAVPHALGLEPLLYAKIVGVSLTVGTFAITGKLAWRLPELAGTGERRVATAGALLMLAVSHSAVIHAVSGMETALYTFLLQLFLYAVLAAGDDPASRYLSLLPPLGLLVGLARPEGNLAVGMGLLCVFLRIPKPARWKLLKTSLLALVLPGAVYFAWRLHYYGHMFPLPFYVPGGYGTGRPGPEVVAAFLGSIALPLGFLFAVGLFRTGRRVMPALAAAVALVVFFLFPLHRMAYAFRYLFPVLPFICAVAACGIVALLELLRSRVRGAAREEWVVALAASALLVFVVLGFYSGMRSPGLARILTISNYYATMLQGTHINLGKKLAPMAERSDRPLRLAIADSGAVPYYSKWEAIDTFGLNDAHIALTGEHEPDYVLSQNPDLVILLSKRRETFDPMLPWAEDLRQACLRSGMERIRVFGIDSYALWVMGDPESWIAQELRGS